MHTSTANKIASMQLVSKIRTAWASGSLWPRARRYISVRVTRPAEVIAGYVSLPRGDRQLDVRTGFVDHRGREYTDIVTDHDLHRICLAYRKAKADERNAPDDHQVRGIWAEILQTNFRPLIEAATAGDLKAMRALLENFFREPFASGMGGDELRRSRSVLGRWYTVYVWNRYYRMLRDLGFNPVRNDLWFPHVGNPAGVVYRGHVVTLETLRHIYHAVEVRNILRGIDRPVIVEIGGGLGGQALQVMLRRPDASYRIFDIPEVAMVSAYFLIAEASQKVWLYGEVDPRDEAEGVGVFPHFAIGGLPGGSVDLFYNSTSFSEMDARSARAYLRVIERACRRYFMHDNHDEVLTFRSDDGSTSTNLVGSKMVPDPERFKLIYKKPRVHGLPEDRGIPHFEYLYERLA